MNTEQDFYQAPLLPEFGEKFLMDHAGAIMKDPRVAIVEVVANCWDAGADRVEIKWFPDGQDYIEVKDNGTGMTPEEFTERWLVLSYNRRDTQGPNVQFPTGNLTSPRKVFGRNGKGRHGMFRFSDEYYVETIRSGWQSVFKIVRVHERSDKPFNVIKREEQRTSPKEHGTRIWAESKVKLLDSSELIALIGSKFVADPSFRVFVNDHEVELTDLSHLYQRREVSIDGLGSVDILLFDTETTSQTTKQHGVAWWVNKRLVGDVEWKKISGESYLDGRVSKAKRYTFVVQADILEDEVLADWGGFQTESEKTKIVASVAERYIDDWLHQLFQSTYKERKRNAIEDNKDNLLNLPPVSRWQIGQFLDEIQKKCPTIRPEHLSDAVEVLSKLENSRSGYALLQQLAQLPSDDLDGLHSLLQKWTVREANTVLDELNKRMKLIERLGSLVEDPTSDELHDIQPLFERGLWIFGPEYESVEFTSNKSLATVIRRLFGGGESMLKNPRRRPDFVALSDSSIGVYSCDSYNSQGMVNGLSKVLILELKRGGFELTRKEVRQGEDYEIEIRRSGKVSKDTQIVVFVLGTQLGDDARAPIKKGNPENTFVYPTAYSTVLRQAHARTFNLTEKLKRVNDALIDREVEQILRESVVQSSLL